MSLIRLFFVGGGLEGDFEIGLSKCKIVEF